MNVSDNFGKTFTTYAIRTSLIERPPESSIPPVVGTEPTRSPEPRYGPKCSGDALLGLPPDQGVAEASDRTAVFRTPPSARSNPPGDKVTRFRRDARPPQSGPTVPRPWARRKPCTRRVLKEKNRTSVRAAGRSPMLHQTYGSTPARLHEAPRRRT